MSAFIGCGMSLTDGTRYIVENMVKQCEKPLVIDADGINALALNIDVLTSHRQEIVITPHIAEFARLVGKDLDFVIENAEPLAVDFCKNTASVLCLNRTEQGCFQKRKGF
ncbi:MAG: hypothetical protein L6V93_04345 [Clostridiales bacterium]|nr:MAG: hypothetical protein L6V93_04345 [Clostridiales bacterium]